MAVKTKILEVLGDASPQLLLLEKVHRSLQANERVKYFLSLLQMALAQAHEQAPDPDDLSVERRRAGIEDADFDRVVPEASLAGEGVEIHAGSKLLALALEETSLMVVPLQLAGKADAEGLGERLARVLALCRPYLDGQLPHMKLGTGVVPGEPGSVPPQKAAARGPLGRDCAPPGRATLPRSLIPRLTSADRRAEDSLHLVVMDAHQALNRLVGELGGRQERIGNADALGLTPDDRRLVEAFSDGVSSTLHLKGGHPGLGTTAVRAGARLLLQNDIGETEAHVILIEVGERELEITYTDVHEKRVEFFLNLLRDIPVRWKKTETRSGSVEEGGFLLVRGKLSFPDLAAAARILRTIGANLVFLIDWNRARKKLRNFLKGSDSREVLSWSSRERIGHLPFISYGDEELIYEALEALPRGTVRRGEPLSSILGRRGAVEFIQEALRLARDSHDRQEPRTLLVDRLRCALLARAGKRGRQAEEDLEEMAVLAVECALVFRDALRAVSRPVPGLLARSHGRMTAWEERADERLNRIRKLHLKDPRVPLSAAALVDDALDALEDGCDLARALSECFRPGDFPGDLVEVLERSAEETLRAAQLFLRILCLYRRLLRGGTGERLFQLINELKVAEHAGDGLKRTFRWRWLAAQGPPRALDALRELQDRVEEALNALARSGFAVHDLAYRAMENPHG